MQGYFPPGYDPNKSNGRDAIDALASGLTTGYTPQVQQTSSIDLESLYRDIQGYLADAKNAKNEYTINQENNVSVIDYAELDRWFNEKQKDLVDMIDKSQAT